MNSMIDKAKVSFLKPRLDPSVGMKTLWKNAKSLGFHHLLRMNLMFSPQELVMTPHHPCR